MGKTGPKSQLTETMKEIRFVLLKTPLLSAKEVKNFIRRNDVPSSYPTLKRALDLLVKRGELAIQEYSAERGSIPKKVYFLKDKGLEKAEKSGMLNKLLDDLRKLPVEELVQKLAKYELVGEIKERFNDLTFEERVAHFQRLADQGDRIAAEKLRKIKEKQEELKQFEKEVAEAPSDKKFEVLMKYRRASKNSQ